MNALEQLKLLEKQFQELEIKKDKLMKLWWQTAAKCPKRILVPASRDDAEYYACGRYDPCNNFMCPAILGEIKITE